MKKDKDLEFLRGMEKLKAAPVKAPDYTSDLEKDVVRVSGPQASKEPVTRIKNATQKIDTKGIAKLSSGEDFAKRIADKIAQNKLAKKAMGIIPFAGAAMGLASGDPAMAAEEAAGDIPVLGQAYEAVRPDAVGESAEEERMMLAEDRARKAYAQSPAAMARIEALKKIQGE